MSRVKLSWLPQGLVKAMGFVPYTHSCALVGTTSGEVLVNDIPFELLGENVQILRSYDVIMPSSKARNIKRVLQGSAAFYEEPTNARLKKNALGTKVFFENFYFKIKKIFILEQTCNEINIE